VLAWLCLERGADFHMALLMSLPLTVSCFSKIQIGFTFLVPAHLGSPGKRAVKRVCVCSINCFVILYKSLVRSHLEYANSVRYPKRKIDIDKLERVQN